METQKVSHINTFIDECEKNTKKSRVLYLEIIIDDWEKSFKEETNTLLTLFYNKIEDENIKDKEFERICKELASRGELLETLVSRELRRIQFKNEK